MKPAAPGVACCDAVVILTTRYRVWRNLIDAGLELDETKEAGADSFKKTEFVFLTKFYCLPPIGLPALQRVGNPIFLQIVRVAAASAR